MDEVLVGTEAAVPDIFEQKPVVAPDNPETYKPTPPAQPNKEDLYLQ